VTGSEPREPSAPSAPWAVKAAKAQTPATGSAAVPPAAPATPPDSAPAPAGRRRILGWSAAGALLVAAAVTGVIVLGGGDDDASSDTGAAGATDGANAFGAPPARVSDGTDRDDDRARETAGRSTPVPSSAAPTPTGRPTPTPVEGDLGLGVPISSPACDGSWVVFLGAATDPATYVADVNAMLSSQPGTAYTLTRGGCSSMRQQLDDGSLIYAVYTGPYPDQAAACSARGVIGGVAYVKRMDDATPPDKLWQC
jgi:hypothetical protein